MKKISAVMLSILAISYVSPAIASGGKKAPNQGASYSSGSVSVDEFDENEFNKVYYKDMKNWNIYIQTKFDKKKH